MKADAQKEIALFDNKIFLITGGTGSFGNTMLQRLLKTAVREIRIFSRDEKKQDDMRQRYANDRLSFYLGDVRDPGSLRDTMVGVDYVFHAAALKQVPSCEFYPVQALRTNALGTENVVEAAVDCHVKRFILLSTDKAVYPINAMGISKAMAERIVLAKARVAKDRGTILCITRYGNVMASRGSVIPLLVDQLQQNKPLTITDPKMTRFMMSLTEAIDLVLHAFQYANSGDLFIQKAPATTLETLVAAIQMVFQKTGDIRIIGARHGEKLHETLLTQAERMVAEDQGSYYCVPADARDLNYAAFFSEGSPKVTQQEDYTSQNTRQLSVNEMVQLLSGLDYIQTKLIRK